MATSASQVEGSQARRSPLAIYRFAKGYSQRSLAEQAGITRETVANIENGHTHPTLRTARAIATVLGINPDALIPAEEGDR